MGLLWPRVSYGNAVLNEYDGRTGGHFGGLNNNLVKSKPTTYFMLDRSIQRYQWICLPNTKESAELSQPPVNCCCSSSAPPWRKELQISCHTFLSVTSASFWKLSWSGSWGPAVSSVRYWGCCQYLEWAAGLGWPRLLCSHLFVVIILYFTDILVGLLPPLISSSSPCLPIGVVPGWWLLFAHGGFMFEKLNNTVVGNLLSLVREKAPVCKLLEEAAGIVDRVAHPGHCTHRFRHKACNPLKPRNCSAIHRFACLDLWMPSNTPRRVASILFKYIIQTHCVSHKNMTRWNVFNST